MSDGAFDRGATPRGATGPTRPLTTAAPDATSTAAAADPAPTYGLFDFVGALTTAYAGADLPTLRDEWN